MRGFAVIVLVFLGACAREVETKDFKGVAEKACACTGPKCGDDFVAAVRQLRIHGSEPENAVEATRYLEEARACIAKLDPAIDKKLDEAF